MVKLFGESAQITAQCFPETSSKIHVINAPRTFSMLWNLFQPFVDPVTAQKVTVSRSGYLETLKKDINEDMIPKEYGGKGKWDIQMGGFPREWEIFVTDFNTSLRL